MGTDLVIGTIVGLVVAWLLLVAVLWIKRPREVALVEVLRLVPDIARLIRDLLADRTVPGSVRIALAGLLVWLISPIDLIPEFVPVLGPLDDAVVAVLVLRFAGRRLGDATLRAHWRGSSAGYELLARLMGGK